MWRCTNCGLNMASGSVCPVCGRAIDPSVAEIEQKVRRMWVFSDVSRRWTRRGIRIGFFSGLLIAALVAVTQIALWIIGPGPGGNSLDDVMQWMALFLGLPLGLSLCAAATGLFLAKVVRPVCIALFCSVERFEQEYGKS